MCTYHTVTMALMSALRLTQSQRVIKRFINMLLDYWYARLVRFIVLTDPNSPQNTNTQDQSKSQEFQVFCLYKVSCICEMRPLEKNRFALFWQQVLMARLEL